MSCWVVPDVAAELWGVPVADVIANVQRGALASKTEYGFTLVDVMPNSPTFERAAKPPKARPLTFKPAPVPVPAMPAEDEAADEFEKGQLDWRPARRSAGRLRRPPQPASLAA